MLDWTEYLDMAISGKLTLDHMPPYIKELEFPVIYHWQDKAVYAKWEPDQKFNQGAGIMFGGYISALADYLAGSAMFTVMQQDDMFVTRKLEIDYKRPVRAGIINIKAEAIEQDAQGVVVQVIFANEKDEVHAVSHVYQTLFKQ